TCPGGYRRCGGRTPRGHRASRKPERERSAGPNRRPRGRRTWPLVLLLRWRRDDERVRQRGRIAGAVGVCGRHLTDHFELGQVVSILEVRGIGRPGGRSRERVSAHGLLPLVAVGE